MKSRTRWTLCPDARAATGPGEETGQCPSTKRQEKPKKSAPEHGGKASRLTTGSAKAVPARDESHLEQLTSPPVAQLTEICESATYDRLHPASQS